ncbi:hypothetical protein B566_EDAN012851 [Ephemera danica]|nr:hypothetical protein B566_EDAN012851 [Ephemera danica]
MTDLTMKSLALLLLVATAVLAKPETRIVGGSEAQPGDAPFVVSIQDRDGQHFCAGTIISSNAILASAPCLEGQRLNAGRVIAGTLDISGTGGGTVHRARSITIHPNYSLDAGGKPVHDIAIATLTPDFVFDTMTNASSLPLQDAVLLDGTPMQVAGWGTTTPGGSMSFTLNKATVSLIDPNACSDLYAEVNGIAVNQICAGGNGRDACSGDSGGPLYVAPQVGGKGVVWGLVSWGFSCASDTHPGVYTEVSKYRDWIDQVLAAS